MVDIAIATVLPERARVLTALLRAIQAQAPRASVRVEVHTPGDHPRARVARIYGRATGQHLVALEDDAILAPDWWERIRAHFDSNDCHKPVAWFAKADRPPQLTPSRNNVLPSALCVTVPVSVARRVPAEAEQWWREHPRVEHHATDVAVGAALSTLGHPPWTMYPSAVQHRTEADCPSTNGARGDRLSASYERRYGH